MIPSTHASKALESWFENPELRMQFQALKRTPVFVAAVTATQNAATPSWVDHHVSGSEAPVTTRMALELAYQSGWHAALRLLQSLDTEPVKAPNTPLPQAWSHAKSPRKSN